MVYAAFIAFSANNPIQRMARHESVPDRQFPSAVPPGQLQKKIPSRPVRSSSPQPYRSRPVIRCPTHYRWCDQLYGPRISYSVGSEPFRGRLLTSWKVEPCPVVYNLYPKALIRILSRTEIDLPNSIEKASLARSPASISSCFRPTAGLLQHRSYSLFFYNPRRTCP